ncbi:MAG: DNA polymerase III subunit delta [Bacilli bacterium]|nr:DNA polymerase III subunit delta [Bacilli bacterium]
MNYILYGEQYPMIKKKLNKLLKERLGEPDDFNVAKFDMDNSSLDDALMDASLLPLGYDRKAVVFDNVTFLDKGAKKDDVQKILELVQEPDESIDLFFVVRKGTIDDKSPIVEVIKNNGQILNFVNLTKEDWPRYATKYFADRNIQIDKDALYELIARVDGDLNRFINEADKLCLYKDHLSIVDIVLMVAKPIEDDAFQMSNALIAGDNSLALSIYRDLKLGGQKAIDPLIPMLANQFRFFSKVFFLYDKGLERDEIASELSANPFRVKIALQNRRHLSRRDIAHVLDDLYYLDYQIKSGQIDRFYGFELFLINFPN